jgi:hypothetical protein
MEDAKTESAVKNRFIVTVAVFSLLGVGFLSGMIVDCIRFDEARSGLLARLEENTQRVHQRLIAIERGESSEGSIPGAKEK